MNPLNSKWFALFLIAVAGCLVFALLGLNVRRAEFRQAAEGAERKVHEAEDDRTHLEKFLTYFKSPQFLEKQARTKLNYKSPDEEVAFVFKDPNLAAANISGDLPQNTPNYMKWWHYILGR